MKKKPGALARSLKKAVKRNQKHLRNKTRLLKARGLFLVVLPVCAAVLAAETAKTWLRIRLRSVPGEPDPAPSVPEPVELDTFRPEFITPVPVETETLSGQRVNTQIPFSSNE